MSMLFEHFAGNDAAAVVIFLALFLVIVGGALFLTPRIARWVDRQKQKNPGFYDGMLEQDPQTKEKAEEKGDGNGAD